MKNSGNKRRARRIRIKKHIRKKIAGTPDRPRLTVYRSLKGIYAQLIDDSTHSTIVTVSSLSKSLQADVTKAKGKVEVAKLVGKAMGEEIKKRELKSVVFDRNGYLYHGRIKAVADGAREAGIKF
ncbi:50S ribosomal protein L18 [bacterium I07]|nr:50S ribosomal protein L18 [bacterium I07]